MKLICGVFGFFSSLFHLLINCENTATVDRCAFSFQHLRHTHTRKIDLICAQVKQKWFKILVFYCSLCNKCFMKNAEGNMYIQD